MVAGLQMDPERFFQSRRIQVVEIPAHADGGNGAKQLLRDVHGTPPPAARRFRHLQYRLAASNVHAAGIAFVLATAEGKEALPDGRLIDKDDRPRRDQEVGRGPGRPAGPGEDHRQRAATPACSASTSPGTGSATLWRTSPGKSSSRSSTSKKLAFLYQDTTQERRRRAGSSSS